MEVCSKWDSILHYTFTHLSSNKSCKIWVFKLVPWPGLKFKMWHSLGGGIRRWEITDCQERPANTQVSDLDIGAAFNKLALQMTGLSSTIKSQGVAQLIRPFNRVPSKFKEWIKTLYKYSMWLWLIYKNIFPRYIQ